MFHSFDEEAERDLGGEAIALLMDFDGSNLWKVRKDALLIKIKERTKLKAPGNSPLNSAKGGMKL